VPETLVLIPVTYCAQKPISRRQGCHIPLTSILQNTAQFHTTTSMYYMYITVRLRNPGRRQLLVSDTLLGAIPLEFREPYPSHSPIHRHGAMAVFIHVYTYMCSTVYWSDCCRRYHYCRLI